MTCVALVSLHQRIESFVTGERPFKCDLTGFSLSPLKNWIICDRRERPFKWDACGFGLTPSKNWIICHRREKPFKWDTCGFSLTPSKNWIICYRRETIQVWHMWLLFHPVSKFNYPQTQAHWRASLRMWPLWLHLLLFQRCACSQEEATWPGHLKEADTCKEFSPLFSDDIHTEWN